jgi:hypothetical protein
MTLNEMKKSAEIFDKFLSDDWDFEMVRNYIYSCRKEEIPEQYLDELLKLRWHFDGDNEDNEDAWLIHI